ncbi:hypothetical protein F5B19DRAFT_504180 [Rostrohypoxylon terebratum]|nr:hypothetical protein F5B19DRAFT_504180 [Rostrohypoxylon terebratum]
MFQNNQAAYPLGSVSNEDGGYDPNAFVPSSWLSSYGTYQPPLPPLPPQQLRQLQQQLQQQQQQMVALSQIQGWADINVDFPSNNMLETQNSGYIQDMPTAQGDGTYNGMSTMLDINQPMAQNGPIDENWPSNQTPDMLQDPHSNYINSQENPELFDSSESNFETPSEHLPVFGGNQDTNLGSNLQPQESRTESTEPTINLLDLDLQDFDLSQLPGDEPEGLFDPPIPQNESAEVFSPLPVPQMTLPQLSTPPEDAQPPSSHQSNQSQGAMAPLPGRGLKRSRSPEEEYLTPESIGEGHQSSETQRQPKRPRTVGRNSCQNCRRSKIKCVHTPGMEKCQHCEKKGLDCVNTGVDNRTNKSATEELYSVLNKNHALIQEFVAVLYLLSYEGAEKYEQAHKEACGLFDRNLVPTRILEYIDIDKSASEIFPVEGVRELNKHRFEFEKLEERRAAIKEADEYGKRTMSALFTVTYFLRQSEISDETVRQILRDARLGGFDHPSLRSDDSVEPIFTEAIKTYYNGAPTPSPITLKSLPVYRSEFD